jgi:predicted nuclease with TOPRIM domain
MIIFFKRYLQVEDHLEEIKRENEEKLQSLESIVKIFEIKARNASDHVGRLEDKENDMKQEYKRLHDRYCEVKKKDVFFHYFIFFLYLVIQSSL